MHLMRERSNDVDDWQLIWLPGGLWPQNFLRWVRDPAWAGALAGYVQENECLKADSDRCISLTRSEIQLERVLYKNTMRKGSLSPLYFTHRVRDPTWAGALAGNVQENECLKAISDRCFSPARSETLLEQRGPGKPVSQFFSINTIHSRVIEGC